MRLLLGLDTTPGSGYLCVVRGGASTSVWTLARSPPRRRPDLCSPSSDENHRGGPVDQNLRQTLPEVLLLQRRNPHRDLPHRITHVLDLWGKMLTSDPWRSFPFLLSHQSHFFSSFHYSYLLLLLSAFIFESSFFDHLLIKYWNAVFHLQVNSCLIPNFFNEKLC